MNADEAVRCLRVIHRLLITAKQGAFGAYEAVMCERALSELANSVAGDDRKLEKVCELRVKLNGSILARPPVKTTFEPEFRACESLMMDFGLRAPDWKPRTEEQQA